MYAVLGIGNPGKKYDNTRHNIGFIALDYTAAFYNIKINKIKHKSLIGEGVIEGERVIFIKPQTFVNLSGEAARDVLSYYKIPPENLIVIHDDINLEEGSIRIRKKGSDGGHNGIKSILYQLSSESFTRIRLGVGARPEDYDMADWVLSHFSDGDIKIMSKVVEKIPECLTEIIKNGTESAMNKFNCGGGRG